MRVTYYCRTSVTHTTIWCLAVTYGNNNMDINVHFGTTGTAREWKMAGKLRSWENLWGEKEFRDM